MPSIHGASGPVTMGCFCHSFPVQLISTSNTVSCWDPTVTPEIQMGSAPSQFDGIRVHCAPVSTRASYCLLETPGGLMCQAIESTQSNKCGYPSPPPGCRQGPTSPGVLVIVIVLNDLLMWHVWVTPSLVLTSCKYQSEVPSLGSEVRSALLLCLVNCPLETGGAPFLGESSFVIFFPCNSCTRAFSVKVGFPYHFLMSFQWSCR